MNMVTSQFCSNVCHVLFDTFVFMHYISIHSETVSGDCLMNKLQLATVAFHKTCVHSAEAVSASNGQNL